MRLIALLTSARARVCFIRSSTFQVLAKVSLEIIGNNDDGSDGSCLLAVEHELLQLAKQLGYQTNSGPAHLQFDGLAIKTHISNTAQVLLLLD
jgi:hypothetical protein